MDKLIEKSLSLVLGEVAKKLQPRLPWLDKLFQLNKIEIETSETLSRVADTLSAVERESLAKRNTYVATWRGKARASDSPDVRANETLVGYVAAAAYALEASGVREVVILDHQKVLAVIGGSSFEVNPEETLLAIVKLAKSPALLKECDAYGFVEPEEVVSKKVALQRLSFLFHLMDIFLGPWSGTVHAALSSDEKRKAFEEIKLSITWLTEEERREMRRQMAEMLQKQVDVKKIAHELDGSSTSDAVPYFHAFVVGVRAAGKSTTRWLLTGEGRDGVSLTQGNSTKEVSHSIASNGHRLKVWDTPGLNEGEVVDQAFVTKIKAEMMGVSHISVIILQVLHNGREPSPQEAKLLKDCNAWLGGNLKENLIIVFKAKPTALSREQWIKDWEKNLEDVGIGGIGDENYVFFSAHVGEDPDEEIVRFNISEVERAFGLIEKKPLCIVETNKVAARALLESAAVKEGERKENLRRTLEAQNREETDAFKEVVFAARGIYTHFADGLLHISTEKKVYYTPTIWKILSLGFYRRKILTTFVIRATCDRTWKALETMGKRGTVRRLDPKERESWVKDFFRPDMQLMALTKHFIGVPRSYHIFFDKVVANSDVLRQLIKLLGSKKAKHILMSIQEKEKSERFAEIANAVKRQDRV